MLIDMSELEGTQAYHLMTQTIIPRPVAWVLTENEGGSMNLAPFSFFTAIGSNPPIIMFSVGKKPSGEVKDTRRNIERTGNFVLHIAGTDLAGPMTETSRTLDYGESEMDRVNLTLEQDWGQPLPRVAQCDVAMFCTLYQMQEIGNNAQGLVFGEIKSVYLSDRIAEQTTRLHVDAKALNPIARLGASEYASLGEVISIPRPE
jgi:flavin reductase (DIM6/NTAB) family NADH-FMN oxidoreductase RutF